MAWYNNSWAYRVKITVDNTKVGETLSNYPVYVDLANLPAGFHTNVNQTDARDIRVTTSDGFTEVPREVVSYTAASDTGELHFKAPSISHTADTDFYIYYGNASATEPAVDATYGSENVWSNYSYVSHDGGLVDSSGNLSPTNTNTTSATGKMGYGRAYNGSSQFVNLNTTTLLNGATSATVQAWSYLTGDLTRDYPIITKWDGAGWLLWADDVTAQTSPASGTTNTVAFAVNSNGAGGRVNGKSNAMVKDTWISWHATFEASTAIRLYKNGAQNEVHTTSILSAFASHTAVTYVGNSGHASSIKWFQGTLDEIRITTTTLSANWITTEYNNQNSPSTFYAVGAQESLDTTYTPKLLGLLGIGA